jgi:type III secretion protein S
MNETLHFFQQGLTMAILLSAPPLIMAAACGMVVSLLQAVTQIQDQTLPYVVKLVAVGITLALMGRWIGVELIELANMGFTLIPNVGR